MLPGVPVVKPQSRCVVFLECTEEVIDVSAYARASKRRICIPVAYVDAKPLRAPQLVFSDISQVIFPEGRSVVEPHDSVNQRVKAAGKIQLR